MTVSGGSAQTRWERLNSAGAPKLEPTEWISWLSLVGAPKLGGSAQTRREPDSMAGAPKLSGLRERPNSATVDNVSRRDPHCEVMLSGRTSHTRVESISLFCPRLDLSGGYGDLAYVILCNTLVLRGWSVINPGVSSGGTSNSTILPH